MEKTVGRVEGFRDRAIVVVVNVQYSHVMDVPRYTERRTEEIRQIGKEDHIDQDNCDEVGDGEFATYAISTAPEC